MSDYFIHHVPGRLRVKDPALKGKLSTLEGVQEALIQMTGVKQVKIKTTTGSVLIHYCQQQTCHHDIIEALKEHEAQILVGDNGEVIDTGTKEPAYSKATAVFGKVVAQTLAEKLVERSAYALIAAIT